MSTTTGTNIGVHPPLPLEAGGNLPAVATARLPRLESGDRLSRPEFERRYAAMPDVKKAELVEGVVFVSSPVSFDHCDAHAKIVLWLATYALCTLGVWVGDNGTVRLDMLNEPQPDVSMRITNNRGQSRVDADRYLAGPPELVCEIAVTSASRDLHAKSIVYCRNGVREYLVWQVWDNQFHWFVLQDGQYVPKVADADGVLSSDVFPGLRLKVESLLSGNMVEVMAVLEQGLASPEHAEFCAAQAK